MGHKFKQHKELAGMENRKKVYLTGPMRGYPDWNFPAFDRAEQAWRDRGWLAFSPAATFRALGYAQDACEVDRSHAEHAIQIDLACIYAADAIALLPGWESSRGATVELALAQFLGLEIYGAESMERIYPPLAPWSIAKTTTCYNADAAY